MWLPLLVLDAMPNGTILELNILILASGVTCIIAMIGFLFLNLKDRTIYIMGVFATLGLAVMITVFIVQSEYSSITTMRIIFWIVWSVTYGLVIINEEVFLVNCLAKLVSSDIQTVSESARISMARIGALLGLSASPFLFHWFKTVSLVYITMAVTFCVVLLLRRKTLSAPKITIKATKD